LFTIWSQYPKSKAFGKPPRCGRPAPTGLRAVPGREGGIPLIGWSRARRIVTLRRALRGEVLIDATRQD